jgi:Family of unknown function (DUF5654)
MSIEIPLILLMKGVLTFTAALAWNNAVKTSLDTLFPTGRGHLLAPYIYAILITLFVIAVAASYNTVCKYWNDASCDNAATPMIARDFVGPPMSPRMLHQRVAPQH